MHDLMSLNNLNSPSGFLRFCVRKTRNIFCYQCDIRVIRSWSSMLLFDKHAILQSVILLSIFTLPVYSTLSVSRDLIDIVNYFQRKPFQGNLLLTGF